jgi:hypothetical protein
MLKIEIEIGGIKLGGQYAQDRFGVKITPNFFALGFTLYNVLNIGFT